MATTYTFKRGAPIVIDLVVTAAGSYDPSTLTARARVKKALGNSTLPPPDAPEVAVMAVAFNAAAGQEPAFWRLSLAAGAIDNEGYGLFATDVELSSGGTVLQITDPVLIRIAETVTPE